MCFCKAEETFTFVSDVLTNAYLTQDRKPKKMFPPKGSFCEKENTILMQFSVSVSLKLQSGSSSNNAISCTKIEDLSANNRHSGVTKHPLCPFDPVLKNKQVVIGWTHLLLPFLTKQVVTLTEFNLINQILSLFLLFN